MLCLAKVNDGAPSPPHQREERVQKEGGVALHELGVRLPEAVGPDGLLDVPQVRMEDGYEALVYQRSGKTEVASRRTMYGTGLH